MQLLADVSLTILSLPCLRYCVLHRRRRQQACAAMSCWTCRRAWRQLCSVLQSWRQQRSAVTCLVRVPTAMMTRVRSSGTTSSGALRACHHIPALAAQVQTRTCTAAQTPQQQQHLVTISSYGHVRCAVLSWRVTVLASCRWCCCCSAMPCSSDTLKRAADPKGCIQKLGGVIHTQLPVIC